MKKLKKSADWVEELNKSEHTPETEEHGISSFVFRSQKPFSAKRFWDFVQNKFPTIIIRSKGLFWMSSRPAKTLNWSQAGGSLKADSAGVWWCSMAFEKRTQYLSFIENQKTIESGWDKTEVLQNIQK